MELLLKKTSLSKKDTRIVWTIMLPALFELVMSHLFSMVDTVMLGHSVNSTVAIASVGLTNSPFNMCNGVISALNIGVTAAVAWAIGAKKNDDARSIAGTALILDLIIGLLVTAGLYIWAGPIIRFMGGEPDTFDFAVEYLRIIAAGMVPLALLYGITGSLRGVGETKLPMIYNLISNFLNVIGNYVLIYGKFGFPELGVAGAGISTTFSRYMALFMALGVMFFAKHDVRLKLKDLFSMRLQWIKRITNVGGTAAVEQFIMQIGFFFFAKTVASLGTAMFAAHQIALSVNGLTWMAPQAFGVAATTLVGQSMGAGNPKRADGYMRFIYRTALFCSVCFAVVFLLFIRQIALIYTNDPEVVQYSADALRIIAIGMPGIFMQVPVGAGLRGAGDSKFPLIASALGIWIFRVGCAPVFIKTFGWGLNGAWLCIALDQYVRGIVVYLRFLTGKWKTKHV